MRLLELGEELGCGALGRTVGKVEDYVHVRAGSGVVKRVGLTFFYTVLLCFAIGVNLARYALDALVVVVLGGMALLGVCAF